MSVGLSERPKPARSGAMHAKAGVAHRRDHLAPQKRPGRLAVEEQHGRAFALVHVGQAQAVDLAVVRLRRESPEPLSKRLLCVTPLTRCMTRATKPESLMRPTAWRRCRACSTSTRGRREVQELTGNRWVPTLVLDDGTVIDDSARDRRLGARQPRVALACGVELRAPRGHRRAARSQPASARAGDAAECDRERSAERQGAEAPKR